MVDPLLPVSGMFGNWIPNPALTLTESSQGPDPLSRIRPLTWCFAVGVAGFEPTTSSSRTKRAAKLRYTPMSAGVPATSFTLAHRRPETKSGFRGAVAWA